MSSWLALIRKQHPICQSRSLHFASKAGSSRKITTDSKVNSLPFEDHQKVISGYLRVLSYHQNVYNGNRHFTFPTPLVGGASAVGRIAALGPDSTALKLGQLVYVDCTIHSRDDPDTLFLSAIHDRGTEGSAKLMRDVWRDGTFAEFAKFPLENFIPLDEARLFDLVYSVQDLVYMARLIVPFGGLRDIRLEPGETIIVAPATGGFGGAGVQVAAAMGARVIAMGRNKKELARLKEHVTMGSPSAQVEIMEIAGDETKDLATLKSFKFKAVDAVLELTPPRASKSTHLKVATSTLRRNGRVSMMGFNENAIAPWNLVAKNISLKGKLMYEREDILRLVSMLENGLFPRGKSFVNTKAFRLEDWDVAFDAATEHTGIGKQVVLLP